MNLARSPLPLAAILTLTLASWVFASGPSAPAFTIPYQGYLELDGTPVSSTLSMAFTLEDAGANVLFTTTRSVDISAGRFALSLGEVTPLPQSIGEANDLFLRIVVDGSVLGGRERVVAAHQASFASEAVHADNADRAIEADRATAAFTIPKVGSVSTLIFPAVVNDPGSITHFEGNNRGELWLSSSDDWGTGAPNDKIVFGEFPNSARFEVAANGNARVYGNLTVDGINQLTCPNGWTSISNGRLCFGPPEASGTIYNAFDRCTTLGARLCAQADYHMACSVINPYAGNIRWWFSDHGSNDDTYFVANNDVCTGNSDGPSEPASNSHRFHCCQ